MEQPINQSVIHLRSRVVTKGRNIKNFVKSQPLFDVHGKFLIDLQAEIMKFGCRIFRCFAYFLKI